MTILPQCPKCGSEYVYEDGELLICPECMHEWAKSTGEENENDSLIIKDAHGQVLL